MSSSTNQGISPGRPTRVLLVDGNRNQRRALAIGLRLTGYEVIETETAREALSFAEKEDFDLVVVDHLLPDRSGAALVNDLRCHLPTARLLLTCAYDLGPNIPGIQGPEHPLVMARPLRTRDLLDLLENLPDHCPA